MIDFKDMKFGCKISPPDDRDYIAGAILPQETQFPEKFRLPYIADLIYNQGTTAKCTCFSTKYIVEYFNIKEFGKRIPMSVDFMFSNRKQGQETWRLLPFEGAYFRDIVSNLRADGVCEDVLAPMKTNPDTFDDFINITDKMRENAKKYNLLSYSRVYSVFDIKNALINGLPVSVSYPVTNKFFELKNGYMDLVTEEYAKQKGYTNHMMTIIGFHTYNNVEYFDVLNSYGKESGDNGIIYIPVESFRNEAWVLVDNKWIDPTPIPTKPKYWRTQVGAYSDWNKKGAQAEQIRIKQAGFDTYLVFVNNMWKIQCGAYSLTNKKGAEDLSKRLTEKGFKNFITCY